MQIRTQSYLGTTGRCVTRGGFLRGSGFLGDFGMALHLVYSMETRVGFVLPMYLSIVPWLMVTDSTWTCEQLFHFRCVYQCRYLWDLKKNVCMVFFFSDKIPKSHLPTFVDSDYSAVFTAGHGKKWNLWESDRVQSHARFDVEKMYDAFLWGQVNDSERQICLNSCKGKSSIFMKL